MSKHETVSKFLPSKSWFLGLIFILQLFAVSSSFGFESYFRNNDFQVTTDTSDVFYSQVKPVLDKRCVACHSCREAECRLKLTSIEGILRGSNKEQIVGKALMSVKRTKLFHDAFGVPAWRKMGFYSVLDKPKLKSANPRRRNVPRKKDELGRKSLLTAALINKSQDQSQMETLNLIGIENQFCGKGIRNFDDVPGMPYKMHPIAADEYDTLYGWANNMEGRAMPAPEVSLMLKTSKYPEVVKRWESFFNHPSNKARWTSRFLYEHLFLATFYIKEAPGEFFELVRSSTPWPQPIAVSSTLHAFEKPKAKTFYYRLRKKHSTIVDKNHFVYEVEDKSLAELKEMFWTVNWGKGNNDKTFSFKNSNPLVAFKHMPAKARYVWMLKNSHLLLDISARSQNCRSEGAAAPYWDNMLHVFLKPESDATVVFGKEFYDRAGKYLPIPNTTGGRKNPFRDFDKEQRKYAKIKKVYQRKLLPNGISSKDIWLGEDGNDKNAMVTVLRHQWTASAHKGQLGGVPRSTLLLDFANWERYFYLCNVATDVSEATLGQSRVVTYLFDVKKEDENQFLSLFPEYKRDFARAALVEGLDFRHEFVNDFSLPYNKKNGYDFKVQQSYGEMITSFIGKTFPQEIIGKRSYLFKERMMSEDNLKSKLEALNKFRGGMATHMPNVSYLRVANDDGTVDYFTITANRYFKVRNDLNFFDKNFEKKQRSPERDSLEVYEGIFVNYPEKIYSIDAGEADQFISDMMDIRSREGFLDFNSKYGLDQMSQDFWPVIDEMNTRYIGNHPIHGGIIDLHRYGSLDKEAPL